MTRLEPDSTAPALWARYYDIDHGEPFVCDRDGIPRRHLSEIGTERRNGYAWYSTKPAALYKLYDKWAARHDPMGKRQVTLLSKGGNERGVFEMFRKERVDPSQFDVIVSLDDNIQDAIGKAPEQGTKPSNFVAQGHLPPEGDHRPTEHRAGGEDRDSTWLVYAEAARTEGGDVKRQGGGSGVIPSWRMRRLSHQRTHRLQQLRHHRGADTEPSLPSTGGHAHHRLQL